MPTKPKPDHRSRVGAERRERMRARLVECALAVFAERGVGASVIQEVIATAEVSQGTFYNYFRTNDELLAAVAEELSNELIADIEAVVQQHEDPAMRLAVGMRLYLHRARQFPLFARFIVGAAFHLASPNNLMYEAVPPHLQAGMASGRFRHLPIELAIDLIGGFALSAIARMAAGEAPAGYPEQVAAVLLTALGLSPKAAESVALAPMERLAVPDESLIARATARSAGAAVEAD